MRFEEGANSFRVLSSAITGWQWWQENGEGNRSPVRVKDNSDVPDNVRAATDSRQRAKHFWAFVVYNIKAKQIQILEVTQRTIMKQLMGLVKDEAWGDPKTYTITITKSKKGTRDVDVEYSTMPRPKQETPPEIVQAYKSMKIDLTALYRGEDPFGNGKQEAEGQSATPDMPSGAEDVNPDDIPF